MELASASVGLAPYVDSLLALLPVILCMKSMWLERRADTHVVLVHALLELRDDRVGLAAQLDDVAELHAAALLGDLDRLGELALDGVDVRLYVLDRHGGWCVRALRLDVEVLWVSLWAYCLLLVMIDVEAG